MKFCRLLCSEGISFGKSVCINHHCDISGHGKLEFGNFVMIAPFVQIITANHRHSDWEKPMIGQPNQPKPVIGANSVVTKNVQPYAFLGGNPANIIKYRFDEESQDKARQV